MLYLLALSLLWKGRREQRLIFLMVEVGSAEAVEILIRRLKVVVISSSNSSGGTTTDDGLLELLLILLILNSAFCLSMVHGRTSLLAGISIRSPSISLILFI